ncbi:MAG: helicase [Rhizobiales bacterium]|nr:helicase [Hyphomicrobiales bacterium]
MSSHPNASDLYGVPGASNVTAVLGPTNTGKTHLAIERMLGHHSGLIGLPLRLLAREVYDKIVDRVGASHVALITGEEKIKPKNARYWVSTVEAMPRDIDVEFVAVDEIQLAADPERGHVFTDRLFHARGTEETLLLGAETMRTALNVLLPGVNFISRPRLSKLSYAGPKKISRLPRRTAIVAFSVRDVYEIAELIRRQRGGAAVVLGALSPRTRNAQVALFQSGEVDFLVATDAIGMGLNLDVHHVAFAGNRKFDGIHHRELLPTEVAQIAGRAGRHLTDGTFGVTGDVHPFDSELINSIEAHEFEQVKALQWRARTLDFASVPRLLDSLKLSPQKPYLQKAREADDVLALEALSSDQDILKFAQGPVNVQRLWEVCQLPDYRKIGIGDHSELVRQLFHFIMNDNGLIPDDWFSEQIEQHNRVEGDIDTLQTRLAHIRTWTFVANRVDWLSDPTYWQGKTREIEDNLSDALHEALTKRFVDKRTSTLMKRLRDSDDLYVEIDDQGQVHVEDHLIGKISGFQFTPISESTGVDGRAARAAAAKVLTKELAMRSEQLLSAEKTEFSFSPTGEVLWKDTPVATLQKGEHILRPVALLKADEQLNGSQREETATKIQSIVNELIGDKLGPLVNLEKDEELNGMARGIAFQLIENLGILEREPIAQDIRQLDQDARKQLRKFGVRFGAFNIYFPLLLKPAAAELNCLLWLLFTENKENQDKWELPRAGLTSASHSPEIETAYYRTAGFHVCGNRVVRVDMLERLADQIRPLVSWRKPKKSTIETSSPSEDTSKPTAEIDNTKTTDAIIETSSDQAESDAASSKELSVDDASLKENATSTSIDASETSSTTSEHQAAKSEPKATNTKEISKTDQPVGSTGDGGFIIIPEMMSIMGCSADELGVVLRSLGFAPDQKKQAKQPLNDQTPSEEASKKSSEQASCDAQTDVSTSDTVEVETSQTIGTDAVSKDKEEEETVILVWRPRRKSGFNRSHGSTQKRHQNKRHQALDGEGHKNRSSHKHRGKKSHKNDGGKGGNGFKKNNGNKKQSQIREKKIDPDSPFAKLQALKDQIENEAG